MYKATHLSAECYPIAKTGGLGDVVGALPKYLNQAGYPTCVVMPWYHLKWNDNNKTDLVFEGTLSGNHHHFAYYIRKIKDNSLGFDVYFVDIPYVLYREQIYGYNDDAYRFIFFQQAALDWMQTWKTKPEVIHCHDHHSGLTPFLIKHTNAYPTLQGVKTIFTIHNGLYTGAFPWEMAKFLPDFHYHSRGLLEWDGVINPLASAVKCADRHTTVSNGYLDELRFGDNPMQWVFNEYWERGSGIINGIDTEVWNPKSDVYLDIKLKRSWADFKKANKQSLCAEIGLDPNKPLFVFIGRLVPEKGAKILTQAIGQFLWHNQDLNFYILGSGSTDLENQIRNLAQQFPANVSNYIGYNEALAHRMYAAADFLLMPSLIEPCGLNQLYAMRYATIPMVRSVGGLKDTVVDFGDESGYGIRFDQANSHDLIYSFHRARALWNDEEILKTVRKRLVSLDFSWTTIVNRYIEIYKN